ncbi:S8 family serine peptidase [Labrenzia sp. R4_2]|uniref:S8 family serine peptidase n=1 Tax=Labrenzia sp. R4_2 TaxID=2821107 RepID=UPI001ADB1A48|nr:S8 family serine peptidase [Labrenzia sp. R4_2]MBO9422760.1 S8 family serine peptidase [Labrenzia sp. R4_2]
MAIPTDPLFINQWYLRNTTAGEFDLNIVDVWDDYTGTGITIAVIDDGVEATHPDLSGNYSTIKDYDLANSSETITLGPSSQIDLFDGDFHGTAAAGILGATANNGIGVAGTAYGSTIFGIKHGQSIADAINLVSGQLSIGGVDRSAEVVNMSLGTLDSTNFFDQQISSIAETNAMAFGVQNGRDSKGTIYVKSAGNERQVDVNGIPVVTETNAAAWNATMHSISVAAVQRTGAVDDYSTPGSSLLVSAFGSPSPGQIQTTDVTGSGLNGGYTDGSDYTTDFNGTSAAAPQVSSVVALMLQANGNLGWRDVQTILANTARHVGTDIGGGVSGFERNAWAFNGADTWNGGGFHFSRDYGFGLVDAKAAVRLAETWGTASATSQNQASTNIDLLNSNITLTANGSVDSLQGTASTVVEIEHVQLKVNFLQWYDLNDLELRIVGPDGTTSVVLDNVSAENDETDSNNSGQWDYFYTNAFRGMTSEGTWTVQLIDQDSAATSPINIDNVELTFHGSSASDDDVYIVTNEFSDFAALSSHSTSFNDTAGTDTLNAAAVDSASIVNLLAGTGTLDGIAVSLSGIENVFTGDGNDQVTGNALANALNSGRGNDTLNGAGGNDTLDGGAGTDTAAYTGGQSEYVIFTGSQGQTVVLDTSANRDGKDSLSNIEAFDFGGQSVTLANALVTPTDSDNSSFEVYRFFNTSTGSHFFTTSLDERNAVIENLDAFSFEGNAFDSNVTQANGTAVFRFYNLSNDVHFYTINAEEAAGLRINSTFRDEGIAYYAAADDSAGGTALFRFFNTQTGSHFYTTSEAERDNIIATLGQYNFEGVAYYVDIA